MEPPEELELARQARSGRRDAFEALVRSHHVRVLRLCLSLLSDRSKAEDAAQEIFIKAYKSLDRFQGASSFSTWLHRIAVNHCLDVLKKDSRRKTVSLEELIEREGDTIQRLLRPPADLTASLEAADLAGRILSLLPSDYRLLLILRETQGLSYQELAETLDCSVDAVKGRLRRAREGLVEKLRHFPGSGDV